MASMALIGSELLAQVKESGDISKSDLVRSCGYVSSKKDGTERLNFTAFYEALLEAKGINLGDSGGKGTCKAGRSLRYVATAQGNANLPVPKASTARLHLHPGVAVELKLPRTPIQCPPSGTEEERIPVPVTMASRF